MERARYAAKQRKEAYRKEEFARNEAHRREQAKQQQYMQMVFLPWARYMVAKQRDEAHRREEFARDEAYRREQAYWWQQQYMQMVFLMWTHYTAMERQTKQQEQQQAYLREQAYLRQQQCMHKAEAWKEACFLENVFLRWTRYTAMKRRTKWQQANRFVSGGQGPMVPQIEIDDNQDAHGTSTCSWPWSSADTMPATSRGSYGLCL